VERAFRQLLTTLSELEDGDTAGRAGRVDSALAAAVRSTDDRMAPFASFLLAHAHLVARGGVGERGLQQRGGAAGSPVTVAAERWLAEHPDDRWLERLGRPRRAGPAPCLRTIEGHEGAVRAVAIHEARRLIVSGGADASVRTWDLATGIAQKVLRTDGHFVCALHLHPDGRRVVVAASPYIEVWDLETGVRSKQLSSGLARIAWLLLHPDGKRVVIADEQRARVRDLETGATLIERDEVQPETRELVLHADGEHVLEVCGFRTLGAWEIRTGETSDKPTEPGYSRARAEMERAAASAHTVLFHPAHRGALSYGSDRRIHFWDVRHKRLSHSFDGHAGTVRALAFNKDGSRLFSGADDGTVRIWDATASAPETDPHAHVEPVVHAGVAHDGERGVTVCGAGMLKVWDLDAAVCITTQLPFWRIAPDHKLTAATLLADGQTVALVDNRGVVKRVEALTSRSRWRSALDGAAFRSVAADRSMRVVLAGDETSIRMFAADSGGQLATVRAPTKGAFGPALLALEEEWIAIASGASLLVYDQVAGGVLIAAMREGDAHVRCLDRAPDGVILSGHTDGTARLWDLGLHACTKRVQAHERAITAISAAPDALLFATASEDRSVRLWTPNGGRIAHWLLDATPTACALGPGGRLLVADATGRVLILRLR
jgi:WD40 repeat protein